MGCSSLWFAWENNLISCTPCSLRKAHHRPVQKYTSSLQSKSKHFCPQATPACASPLSTFSRWEQTLCQLGGALVLLCPVGHSACPAKPEFTEHRAIRFMGTWNQVVWDSTGCAMSCSPDKNLSSLPGAGLLEQRGTTSGSPTQSSTLSSRYDVIYCPTRARRLQLTHSSSTRGHQVRHILGPA